MNRLVIALVALLITFPASGQGSGADDKRRLVEQKIRLVEMLVNSQAAKNAAANSPEAPERLEVGRRSIGLARQALSENRFDDAGQILDEALRSSAPPRRGTAEASLSQDALRHAHQNLIEQVATYRASVEELAPHPKIGRAARELLARLDAKSAEARKFAIDGRLDKANPLLSEAYQLAVSELSRLRAGEEVVLSLNFASPAEEFAYEVKRFESSQIMVNMMIGEGKAEGGKGPMVDGFLGEGRRLRGEAEAQAKAGHHKEGIRLMESATAQLTRALQAMGVPVF